MKEGLPPDEIEPIAHVNGNATEAAPKGADLSKELTPEAIAAKKEALDRARLRGDAPVVGEYAVLSKTFLQKKESVPKIPEIVRKQNEEALKPVLERMERESARKKEEERLQREQHFATDRLRPDENTTIASTGEAAIHSEEIELRGEAAQLHEGESPTSGVQAEEPHWTTEEELEARRPKKKESVIKKTVKSAASASASAVAAGGRAVGEGVKKAAHSVESASGAAVSAIEKEIDAIVADTEEQLAKRREEDAINAQIKAEIAEQKRALRKERVVRLRSSIDSAAQGIQHVARETVSTVGDVADTVKMGTQLAAERVREKREDIARENHESLIRRGAVRRASRAGKSMEDAPGASPTEPEPETIERVLADGVAAETQRKTLEEILNSPDGAAFADLLDRKGISPDEIETDPERLHAQFTAFQARERVTEQINSMLAEMLQQEGAVVGSKQKEAIAGYVEHAVAYYPEEVTSVQETLSSLDAHKRTVEEYQKSLSSMEGEILAHMSIYVDPKTPLPENVHEIFDPGHYKQVSEISDADLDDRERTFTLALSGSEGHKGWKEPALSWAVSFITRDYPTPEEKKAIQRLAYEFKADKKYSSIQERCRVELAHIAELRELKSKHAELVKQRESTAGLIKEQMRRHMKGTEVWQVALTESARETAVMVTSLVEGSPQNVDAADKVAQVLRNVDAVSSNLAFNLGSEMPMEEFRGKAVEHMKALRAKELRKVLAETPVGAGGLDAMFASVDALVASPEIGKHDTAQAVAHIYQSVEKIIPDLPDGRAFYARTVLLKLRAKYGDMVDSKIAESTPSPSEKNEAATVATPSEQTQEVQSSDDVIPGYMPSGMMDEEEVTPARVEESVEAPPVREPDEVIAPEAPQSGRSVHLPATIDTAAIPTEAQAEGSQPELSIPERNVTPQAAADAATPTETRAQISAESAAPRPEVEITQGERMKVLGPTGSIESGWVVEKVDGDAKIVTLAKEGAKRRNKLSVKEIPIDTLKSWQEFADRETLEREFAEVKDMTELFDTFAKLKGVWEGGVFYSSDELVSRVEQARIDSSKINQVPNIGKLRAIVRALPEESVNEQLQEGKAREPYSDPLAEAVAKTGEEIPLGSKKVSWKKREQQAAKNAVLPIESTQHKNVYTTAAFEQYLVDIESFEQLKELLEKTDHVIAGKNEFSGFYLLDQLARAERSGAADWMPGSIPGLQELVAKLLHKRVAEKQ